MAKSTNFSQNLKRLEQIVETLENKELSLEEGMKLLEEGIKIHKKCQAELSSSQSKIDKIISSEEVN